MRWTVTALLLVLLCGSVACDSSKAEKASAPAREVPEITDFRCPAEPGTTFELEVCAAERTARLTGAIKRQVRSILSTDMSAAARARFRGSERAWLSYRAALCESRRDIYGEGGSARRVVFAKCVADETAAHLEELRAFNRNLRRGRF